MRQLALFAFAVLTVATDAFAQTANGLEIKSAASTPAGLNVLAIPDQTPTGKKIDTQIGPTPNAKDFTMWLGDGAAPNLKVSRNGARGQPLTTVILVDLSPSYFKTFWTKETRPAIEAYVSSADAAKDKFILLGFAMNPGPPQLAVGPAIKGQLASVKMGIATSVTGGLDAAFAAVIKEGAPALREILVFTDGADEDAPLATVWDEAIAKANKDGIRVTIVLPPENTLPGEAAWKGITKITKFSMDNPGYAKWVAATAGLGRLAVATGGAKVVTRTTTAMTQGLLDERTLMMKALLIEGTQCGNAKNGQGIPIKIEYVPGAKQEAWSNQVTLPAASWNPGSDVPCPSLCPKGCPKGERCVGGTCAPLACTNDTACEGAVCQNGFCGKPCSSACAGWQECRGGACVARACVANENCGAGSRCANGTCTSPTTKSNSLIYILAGAGGLLLLTALFVLFRKKPPPPVVETPVVQEEPPPPEPETKKAPTDAGVDLDPLPETHLVALGGSSRAGERWRLHKRKTIAGASADAGDGVDLVFGGIKQISTRHAQFDLYPSGDLWVSDLGSTNGTFVNGKKLAAKERMKLAVGDQVKLSQQLVLVVERPGVEPGEPRKQDDNNQADKPAQGIKDRTRFDPGGR